MLFYYIIPLFSFLLSSIIVNSSQVKTILLQLEQALNPSAIRSQLDVAGKDAVNEAKRLVPVDTGNLKSSIYSQVQGNDSVAVGASAEYAGYVETGTSKRNATPFIEPACQTALLELQRNLEGMIRTGRRKD